MRLAEMIKLWLAAHNKSQVDLARELDINVPTLSRFLAGIKLPRAHVFIKLQTWAFGADTPELGLSASDSIVWDEVKKKDAERSVDAVSECDRGRHVFRYSPNNDYWLCIHCPHVHQGVLSATAAVNQTLEGL